MTGILGGLPPGLRGYVAAENQNQRQTMGQLGMLNGILGMQGALMQQQQMAQTQPLQLQLLQEQVRSAQNPAPTKVDLGGAWGLMDRTGAIVARIPKSASPDAQLREQGSMARHQTPSGSAMLSEQGAMQRHQLPSGSAVYGGNIQMRGQNMSDARARETLAQGKIPPGFRMGMDGRMEAIAGGPADPNVIRAHEEAKFGAKRDFNTAGITSIINEAESILKTGKPTSSVVGAGQDFTGSLVGWSVPGAKEAEQLAAIGGALVARMPRMEGPQSDKDVAMYREMAGKVGDRTIPIESRLAALDVVKKLWGKYEKGGVQSSPSPASIPGSGGWSIRPVQ
jgi:hypothetical protein